MALHLDLGHGLIPWAIATVVGAVTLLLVACLIKRERPDDAYENATQEAKSCVADQLSDKPSSDRADDNSDG